MRLYFIIRITLNKPLLKYENSWPSWECPLIILSIYYKLLMLSPHLHPLPYVYAPTLLYKMILINLMINKGKKRKIKEKKWKKKKLSLIIFLKISLSQIFMVSYSRKNYYKPLMDYLKDKISWDNLWILSFIWSVVSLIIIFCFLAYTCNQLK